MLEVLGVDKSVELLYSFEFNSDRKRMSIIIKDNDTIKLYIKGADNVIRERLTEDQPFLKKISFQLDEFSKQGFRTLCMAYRTINQDEFDIFQEKYNKLANVPDREKRICKYINQNLLKLIYFS